MINTAKQLQPECSVHICEDIDYIRSIMFEAEMWERSSDDYSVKSDKLLTEKAGVWLKCYHEGRPMGLATVRPASNSVVNVHIHIPKCNRGKGTRDVGKNVLKWIKNNTTGRVVKVNTKIPVIYKDVIRFAHSLGFQDEGIDRCSTMRKGVLVDRLNLGLLVEEIL